MKDELVTEISGMEADVARREVLSGIWSDFFPQFAKVLFPKRLLLQPDPVIVTDMPIPFDVASSVIATLKSLGLPLGRPGRELLSIPCSPVSVSLEASFTALLSGMYQSENDGHEVQAISSETPMESTQLHLSPTFFLFRLTLQSQLTPDPAGSGCSDKAAKEPSI
ncbi:hypothetical protein DPMN_050523 [Dreissena polymorpha]|uniref:Uncharacterized protein n=1 Tax=Dreissena polymorpha TaxID=45954 RepID=A0A9D4CI10_DREPO|nr:hypothetical protein DPMN_050523 [Dreissena polymorpha]